MTWSNWDIQVAGVIGMIIELVGDVINLALISPVIGVPIILGIVSLFITLALRFINGVFRSGGGSSEK